ncbi:MAG TPA: hypothetical protein DCW68_07680 [Rhodospirillaceae bacterium]|nr:MAG: hypothetical protein A2018_08100 [Alphaproteobacteria bacterium GWF2_58_20]HAU29967.1 hypothetical protein [Rhodospirillaceae bacterium]
MIKETEYTGGAPLSDDMEDDGMAGEARPVLSDETLDSLPEEGEGLQVPPPDEDEEDFGTAEPVVKSSRMLPLMVGGGFLVFAMAMAYFQFRPKAVEETAFVPMDMSAEMPMALPEVVVPGSMENDFPKPFEVSQMGMGDAGIPAILSEPQGLDAKAPVVAMAAFPAPVDNVKPMTIDQTPVREEESLSDAVEGKVVVLEAQIKALEARLTEMSALQAQIRNLERKLMDMSVSETAPAPMVSSMPVAKVVETPKAEPAKAMPVAKAEPAVKPVSAPPAKKVVKAPKWELRSVAGDAAWVGEAGKADVKRVIVGDTLEGLGKITAIHKVDGGWVVEGSRGTLKP